MEVHLPNSHIELRRLTKNNCALTILATFQWLSILYLVVRDYSKDCDCPVSTPSLNTYAGIATSASSDEGSPITSMPAQDRSIFPPQIPGEVCAPLPCSIDTTLTPLPSREGYKRFYSQIRDNRRAPYFAANLQTQQTVTWCSVASLASMFDSMPGYFLVSGCLRASVVIPLCLASRPCVAPTRDNSLLSFRLLDSRCIAAGCVLL
jgi:hypothetical protein